MVSLMERILPPSAESVRDRGVVEQARLLLKYHLEEKESTLGGRVGLDKLHDYLLGEQPHPSVPLAATVEVRQLAKMSRVNVLDLIISSVAQSIYVDGYRGSESSEDAPAWDIFQRNRCDRRQAGIHRAALAYGASYVTVLPGEPVPVIRGHSPRKMVAIYGDDDEWPVAAMQIEPSGNRYALRLYDGTSVHSLSAGAIDSETSDIELLESSTHGAPVTPVVRFLNVVDLDEDHLGEIERLIPIQDQIDDTTFSMLVAQRYAAFRQRWIVGWTAESENQQLKAAASRLWTFDDDDIKVGEFEQTDLAGYLASREASLRHAATISQTPAHELIGQMVNLSAEALVAAEASQRRKVTERQMSFGESWEQVLALAGGIAGVEVDEQAQVRWRDTESRAFSATVDGLQKLHALGVPIELLLERIPGFTQQDVERASALIESGSPLDNLAALFQQQSQDEFGAEDAA